MTTTHNVVTRYGVPITPRQLEVVSLIAKGFTTPAVARELGISPRTAKAHADVLRQKLGAPRRREIPEQFRLLTGRDPSTLAPLRLEHPAESPAAA